MVDRYSSSSSSNYSSNYPSFSSTLLDAIYRSIDKGEVETLSDNYSDPMRTMKAHKFNVKNDTNNNVWSMSGHTLIESDRDQMITANHRRAYTIDKWIMEKKAISDEYNKESRKNQAANDDHLKVRTSSKSKSNSYSSSSSSDFFSSNSGTESVQRPKPIRTGHCSGFDLRTDKFITTTRELNSEPKPKQESGGFLKTKARALKMYSDMKKAKQPMSPGKKLAGFLNSLFSGNGNNLKKSTKAVSTSDHDYSSPSLKSTVTTSTSTCSSASSFSRSCLSKTPSSSRKLSSNNVNGVKRSVRFTSVSMIIDDHEDHCQVNNNNYIKYKENISSIIAKEGVFNNVNTSSTTNNKEIDTVRAMGKNRRVEEVTKDLLRNYHKSDINFDEEEEDDDDDCASCASSDLFELDNLSSIGLMERVYTDELPVYETTRLQNNNRVFANGMTMS